MPNVLVHLGRILFVMLCLSIGSSFAADDDSLAARRKALTALLDEQWQDQLEQSPELATTIGDYRYNDRWTDNSLAATARRQQRAADFLKRFVAIDSSGFPEPERLNRELMIDQLKDGLEFNRLRLHLMPLDQTAGVHLQYPQFMSVLPTDTVRQFEDYIARLNAMPEQIDALIAVARSGLKAGLMPPKFLLEKVVTQCRSLAEPAGIASAFAAPLQKFPDSIPAAEKARLKAAAIAAIDGKVRPAYRRLATFVARDYAPKGRREPGIWALPDGDALYRFEVRSQTTTTMTPQAIHELGLAEVARIEAEQTQIAKRLGHQDLASFRAALKKDRSTFASSPQQIVDAYRRYNAQMEPMLPKLFGLRPKTAVIVKQVEAYRENEAPGASYMQGTPDGKRPGQIEVNTGDFAHRSLLTIESTAYHEGSPGHHMQISIAQTLPELPPFRQQAGYTAYVEGWALYAERLGKDVGFYTEPLSDYGRLSDELLRANRLVLDTGVHYKHWTRQQMVDWFHTHSSDDEPDLQSETDRYIAWPAQALAYKLGQLRILALREEAKAALGDRFDIRAFHDTVLSGGALPLDNLSERVRAWIATSASASP
ncbi:DUF885 domain-containing protein [Nevskia ramosa]|uniref:DUF885 domain-containing protein n=1 Tax=Nevskia ramosa TaxID=64002 RepID=UPI002352E469|nr:DUF885 domain-containing protein [Nevskia ramosa]